MVFLISLILALAFCIIFKKQLIKHPGIFYIIFLVIGAAVPALKIAGVTVGGFVGEYIYPIIDKSALGTAFFVLVMFAGTFSGQSKCKKLLIPIRRQMSIIACLLTFGHNIAYGKTYFVALFVTPEKLPAYQLAAAVCSIIMILILIPLFVTSFIQVRKKMQPKSWKRLQRMAYVFYGLLYVHIMLLTVPAAMHGTFRNVLNAGVYTVVFLEYLVARLLKVASDHEKINSIRIFHYIADVVIAVIVLILTLLISGTFSAKTETEETVILQTVAEEEETETEQEYLHDGIYQGTAFGYTGDITVAVEIENGDIAEIYFESYEDDFEYRSYGDAMLNYIIADPYGDVDAISGATFSTKAVKSAYYKAIEQALK